MPGRGDVVLAVDVHNVHTDIGLFEGDELVEVWRLGTQAEETADVLAADLNGLLATRSLRFADIDGSIVSTTVPDLVRTWPEMARKYLGRPMLVVGPGLKTGMPIRIEHPGELGSNRLVNAVAAYRRIGGATVAVDFSTATAFDIVSADGEYLGSVFAPGIDVSFETLVSRAARLPPAIIGAPGAAIGTTTVDALNSGTVYGAAGLCDGIVRRVLDEMDDDTTVIATGSRAAFIAGYCETIDVVAPHLTLEGLSIIHDRNS
jgi:type III pantothenate kinase